MSHTQGRLRVDPNYHNDIQTADGRLEIAATNPNVLIGGVKPDRVEVDANTIRLVDCWNACMGINPDSVQDLLAALRRVVAVHDEGYTPGESLIEECRNVLTKATGE